MRKGGRKIITDGCCICADDSGAADNLLVYCDGPGCKVVVHESCYGIKDVDLAKVDRWLCQKCAVGDESDKTCIFCPSSEGAMKRTDSGGWAHVICAHYIPHAGFEDPEMKEPIIAPTETSQKINNICCVCSSGGKDDVASYGTYITCQVPGCKASFHVTCGLFEGLLCEVTKKEGENLITHYYGFCKLHLKSRKPRKVRNLPPVRIGWTDSMTKNLEKMNNGLAKKRKEAKRVWEVEWESERKKRRSSSPEMLSDVAEVLETKEIGGATAVVVAISEGNVLHLTSSVSEPSAETEAVKNQEDGPAAMVEENLDLDEASSEDLSDMEVEGYPTEVNMDEVETLPSSSAVEGLSAESHDEHESATKTVENQEENTGSAASSDIEVEKDSSLVNTDETGPSNSEVEGLSTGSHDEHASATASQEIPEENAGSTASSDVEAEGYPITVNTEETSPSSSGVEGLSAESHDEHDSGVTLEENPAENAGSTGSSDVGVEGHPITVNMDETLPSSSGVEGLSADSELYGTSALEQQTGGADVSANSVCVSDLSTSIRAEDMLQTSTGLQMLSNSQLDEILASGPPDEVPTASSQEPRDATNGSFETELQSSVNPCGNDLEKNDDNKDEQMDTVAVTMESKNEATAEDVAQQQPGQPEAPLQKCKIVVSLPRSTKQSSDLKSVKLDPPADSSLPPSTHNSVDTNLVKEAVPSSSTPPPAAAVNQPKPALCGSTSDSVKTNLVDIATQTRPAGTDEFDMDEVMLLHLVGVPLPSHPGAPAPPLVWPIRRSKGTSHKLLNTENKDTSTPAEEAGNAAEPPKTDKPPETASTSTEVQVSTVPTDHKPLLDFVDTMDLPQLVAHTIALQNANLEIQATIDWLNRKKERLLADTFTASLNIIQNAAGDALGPDNAETPASTNAGTDTEQTVDRGSRGIQEDNILANSEDTASATFE